VVSWTFLILSFQNPPSTQAAEAIGPGGPRPAHFFALVGRQCVWPAHFWVLNQTLKYLFCVLEDESSQITLTYHSGYISAH